MCVKHFKNELMYGQRKFKKVCFKHFKKGIYGQRKKLKWELQPVPTVHSNEALKRLSTLSIIALSRKLLEPKVFQNDELEQV